MISIELDVREQAAMTDLQGWQGERTPMKVPGVSAAAVVRESLRQRYASVFHKTGDDNPFTRA